MKYAYVGDTFCMRSTVVTVQVLVDIKVKSSSASIEIFDLEHGRCRSIADLSVEM